jgi:uncharacterized protein YprB with RNaseH-like and TPR domain
MRFKINVPEDLPTDSKCKKGDRMNLILDIETSGLNPLFDRITCIGVVGDDNKPMVFYGEDEKKLLQDFWAYLKKVSGSDGILYSNDITIVGFNVYKFDIRFIHIRSMVNNVYASKKLKKNFIDLQYELACYNTQVKGTLNDYLETIGEEKNGNGLRAIELFEKRDWKSLVAYCKNDVLVTKKLFERCKEAGII